MKLRVLFKRALYRELRSSIGYYDARRIIRTIENNSEELTDVNNLRKILDEKGVDERQTELAVGIIQKYSFLLKKDRDRISIVRPTVNALAAGLSIIAVPRETGDEK